MTHISHIFTCPKCEESITAKVKPNHCPNCGYKFAPGAINGFVEPESICEQSFRIGSPKAHAEFILGLPIESATNIVQDALDVIKTLPSKKVQQSDIRILMGLAIQIGDIAKAYESFLAAGGTHAPGLFINKDEEANELQKTAVGDEATARVPTPLFPPVEQNGGGGDDIIPR